jgi:hypothetical protein
VTTSCTLTAMRGTLRIGRIPARCGKLSTPVQGFLENWCTNYDCFITQIPNRSTRVLSKAMLRTISLAKSPFRSAKPDDTTTDKDTSQRETDIEECALAHDSHKRVLPTHLYMTEPGDLQLGDILWHVNSRRELHVRECATAGISITFHPRSPLLFYIPLSSPATTQTHQDFHPRLPTYPAKSRHYVR